MTKPIISRDRTTSIEGWVNEDSAQETVDRLINVLLDGEIWGSGEYRAHNINMTHTRVTIEVID